MQKQFAFRDDSSAILGILLMLARLLLLKKEITRTTFWVENYKNSVEHVSDDDGDEGKKTICKPNGSLITFSLFTVSSDPPKLDSRFSSLSVVVVGQIMTGRATPPFTSPPMYTFYCIISYQMCTFNKERDASIQTSKK